MTKKPTNTQKKGRKNKTSDLSDDDLWGHIAAGVDPLGAHHKNRAPDVELAPVQSRAVGKGSKIRKSGVALPSRSLNEPSRRPDLPELTHGAQPGIDKNSAKRLKKGQQRIEGRMDLHGMTQEQAHRALNAFVDGAFGSGKRCVLVITGKGLKPDGSIGVLRAAVPRWLNQSPNREKVLAFSYATPKDGGEGALYVMLKRKR